MQTINYTEARNRLAGLMEMASRDREPITITRNGTGVVVLLARLRGLAAKNGYFRA